MDKEIVLAEAVDTKCEVLENIDKAIKENPEPRRGYIGMSGIAKDIRTLWLEWRWCLPDSNTSRGHRILSLGHVVEDECIKYLRQAGYEVWDRNPQDPADQISVKDLGGHFSGHVDGVIKGLDLEEPHLLEIKTANRARFRKLQKDGVKLWSYDYWVQMQCYMSRLNLSSALFFVYCKDDSAIYTEIVQLENMVYSEMLTKAQRLLECPAVPQSTYANRNWYEIKNYRSEHWQAVYWGDAPPASSNCRNCKYSKPIQEGSHGDWRCTKHNAALTYQQQTEGCADHEFMDCLVPNPMAELASEFDGKVEHSKPLEGEKPWLTPAH